MEGSCEYIDNMPRTAEKGWLSVWCFGICHQ